MNRIEELNRRDPEFFIIDDKNIMVIACDSCGGIGLKESDVLKAPNELVGRLTARVPVMELLSLGVEIKTVSLTIINEPSPTGDEIIRGVKSELINYDLAYVISTEKNMKTSMTGLGITVIGLIEKDKLRLCDEDNYMVFIAGTPSVGEEVLTNEDIIFNQEMIRKLIKDDDVLEIIPCGSSGILGELSKLEGFDNLPYIDNDLLNKSCGPATAGVVLSKVDLSKKHKFLVAINKFI